MSSSWSLKKKRYQPFSSASSSCYWQQLDQLNKRMNLLNELESKQLGFIRSLQLSRLLNNKCLTSLKLSKRRSVRQSEHSITWLSLDAPESRYLLAGKSDGNFMCVDLNKDDHHQRPQHQIEFDFVFDSSRLATASAHQFSLSTIKWYPIDSGLFFTCGMDKSLKVWDTNTLQVADQFMINQKLYNLDISEIQVRNGKTLVALALDNGQVRLVDINSGSFTHTLNAHYQHKCICVNWSPIEENQLVSAGSDGQIGLWDIRSSKSCLMFFDADKSNQTKTTVSSRTKTASSSSSSFSSGGCNVSHSSALSSSSSSSSKYSAHTNTILGLTFTSDGRHLISFGVDDRIRLWNAASGANTLVNYGRVDADTSEVCLQMVCSSGGVRDYLFVPSENDLLMYDVFGGERALKMRGHYDSINACLFNAQLNEVYSGARDRNVLVWSPELMTTTTASSSSSSSPFKRARNSNNEDVSGGIHTINHQSLMSNTGRRHRQEDNWSDDDNDQN